LILTNVLSRCSYLLLVQERVIDVNRVL